MLNAQELKNYLKVEIANLVVLLNLKQTSEGLRLPRKIKVIEF